MQPRLEHLRKPDPHSRRAAAPQAGRPPRTSVPRRPRPNRAAHRPASASAPGSEPPPIRDRGLSLLAIFTASALLIVALVCLVGSIDRWWILIPVMAVDLAVTGIVLAVVGRLLDEGSGE